MLMFVNNPERLTASLLTSTVLTMTLLSSGVNAADEPFDSSLFEAEASGTSVAVALAQAVQQVRNEFDSSSNSTRADEGVRACSIVCVSVVLFERIDA